MRTRTNDGMTTPGRPARAKETEPPTAAEKFRAELERAVTMIVNAVGGDGACRRIGYRSLSETGTSRVAEHRFWVVVETRVKGAIVGKDGNNAHRLRELIKTRATVLGNHDPIELWVIGDEREAPDGVFA